VSTLQEIKAAIQALPMDERKKFIAELPVLLPELDGDAAWDRILQDTHPRPALSALLNETEVEYKRDPAAFAETSETEFDRHS